MKKRGLVGTMWRSAARVAGIGFVLGTSLLASGLRAQSDYVRPNYGRFRPIRKDWESYDRHRIPATARPGILRQFEGIVDVFKAAPGLQEPLGGVDIEPNVAMFGRFGDFQVVPNRPLPAMMWMLVLPYSRNPAGNIVPSPSTAWTYAFYFVTNDLTALTGRPPVFEFPGDEPFYSETPLQFKSTSVPGVYTLRDKLQVLTKRNVPFFVPVTRERFLQGRLRKQDQIIKDMNGHPVAKQALADIQAALDALSPESRDAQAEVMCTDIDISTWLCKPGATRGEKLVVPNPDFFDRSLPREGFQLLALWREDNGGGRNSHRVGKDAWDTLDWKALLDLLR